MCFMALVLTRSGQTMRESEPYSSQREELCIDAGKQKAFLLF